MAHLAMDKPAPIEWVELVLADRFGWTLGEIRALPLADILRLLTMMGAESKVHKSRLK